MGCGRGVGGARVGGAGDGRVFGRVEGEDAGATARAVPTPGWDGKRGSRVGAGWASPAPRARRAAPPLTTISVSPWHMRMGVSALAGLMAPASLRRGRYVDRPRRGEGRGITGRAALNASKDGAGCAAQHNRRRPAGASRVLTRRVPQRGARPARIPAGRTHDARESVLRAQHHERHGAALGEARDRHAVAGHARLRLGGHHGLHVAWGVSLDRGVAMLRALARWRCQVCKRGARVRFGVCVLVRVWAGGWGMLACGGRADKAMPATTPPPRPAGGGAPLALAQPLRVLPLVDVFEAADVIPPRHPHAHVNCDGALHVGCGRAGGGGARRGVGD